MKQVIAAIEQEMKYMNDSGDGAEQYHRGYVTALEIVAEFLDRQESGRALHRTSGPAVERLLSFASLASQEVRGRCREFDLCEALTVLEREALRSAWVYSEAIPITEIF